MSESESSWWPCLRVSTLYHHHTTRPVKLTRWPMLMEKLACEVFFFLIHHLNHCQPPEVIKAASNIFAFKWLKSPILCGTGMFKKEWVIRASAFLLLQPYLHYWLSGKLFLLQMICSTLELHWTSGFDYWQISASWYKVSCSWQCRQFWHREISNDGLLQKMPKSDLWWKSFRKAL